MNNDELGCVIFMILAGSMALYGFYAMYMLGCHEHIEPWLEERRRKKCETKTSERSEKSKE